MKIAVVGVGYVGLSTAVCLASRFDTIAVDVDQERIKALNDGKLPVHERGLKSALTKVLSSGRLKFSSEPSKLAGAEIIFIAVGTPDKEDGSIDLSQLRSASRNIGQAITSGSGKALILVKSTVIPGTTRLVVLATLEDASGKKCGRDFGLCSNPEFLREGTAVRDTLSPYRIILGAIDSDSLRMARSFYRKFHGRKTPPIVITTPEGAELIKYGSNSLLASRISFVNLLAQVCELFPGTDVNDVATGIGADPRIGRMFLQAGPGFGGSCFPKDILAFSTYLKGLAIDASMLESIVRVNDFQPQHVVALAESTVGALSGKRVAVLGLSFKAGTGDTRGSRSVPVILGLLERDAQVRVFDPVAELPSGLRSRSGLVASTSAKGCIADTDLVVVLTAWPQFKALKPSDFRNSMRRPAILDARRVYDPQAYSKGITYCALGLGRERVP